VAEDRSVEDEQFALLQEHAELETEHARLEENPHDIPGHIEHRRKLRAHIQRLHAHVARIREEKSS
jgi:hypothetical protein